MIKRAARSSSRDRLLASKEAWQVEDLHHHFPKHTHEEVVDALEDCKRELGDINDREKVLSCLESRLTPQAADGVD